MKKINYKGRSVEDKKRDSVKALVELEKMIAKREAELERREREQQELFVLGRRARAQQLSDGLGEKNFIRDSEKEKLEDRLGDILIKLYERSEENRIDRERREEEQRRREEEARRQEELRKRKQLEIAHTKELVNKADDYRIASEIRAYIHAVVESGSEEATSEWIEWARRKADWYDPTIALNDEYLGKRDHGKRKDEKDFDTVSSRRSWNW